MGNANIRQTGLSSVSVLKTYIAQYQSLNGERCKQKTLRRVWYLIYFANFQATSPRGLAAVQSSDIAQYLAHVPVCNRTEAFFEQGPHIIHHLIQRSPGPPQFYFYFLLHPPFRCPESERLLLSHALRPPLIRAQL